jgi:hypothetical protein
VDRKSLQLLRLRHLQALRERMTDQEYAERILGRPLFPDDTVTVIWVCERCDRPSASFDRRLCWWHRLLNKIGNR